MSMKEYALSGATGKAIDVIQKDQQEDGSSSDEMERHPVGKDQVKGSYTNNTKMQQMRKKLLIRRIESTSRRQVTFCKRRCSLLKKAWELSVLCDTQLALIIFSATGKLFQFASPNMAKVIEKFQNASKMSFISLDTLKDLKYWRHEVALYKDKLTKMEEKEMHLMGENITGLEAKDLHKLEHQLEVALSRLRARKMQLWMEEVRHFKSKEHLLLQENDVLNFKLSEAISTMQARNAKNKTTSDPEESSNGRANPGLHELEEGDGSSIEIAETALQMGPMASPLCVKM